MAGYTKITYFGCEGSYGDQDTHAYGFPSSITGKLVKVMCAGKDYLSVLGLVKQSETLSELIRAVPHVYEERSGGLLGAMISAPEWELVAAARQIHERA